MRSYMHCVFTGWSFKTSSTREMVISSVRSHSHCLARKMIIEIYGGGVRVFTYIYIFKRRGVVCA